eukprot:NODE_5815_length_963_cov_39.515476_g5232_i0.p1 GENE.NODE_5815_length_963_cov_39.515476_g5232_i0~~NODE_5815_length_963_cov_39.515476_g5232_i0.p1  ORF type:complete len:303 (+),score=60.27 NODE_5815_length_963_cov_39.515476_g5232_i0:99-911(+)
MFTDMEVSVDLNQNFSKYIQEKSCDLGPDFSANVLTSGSWPLFPPKVPVMLPRESERGQHVFEQFYKEKYNGRRLTWLHQMSTAIMKTCYALPNNRVYELQVTLYQMNTLLLFNNPHVTTLTALEIQEATHIQEKDIHFALQVLTKNRILVSEPKDVGPQFLPEQTFNLNYEYKSQSRKVTLHTASQKDTIEDPTMKAVCVDRKYAIQAAIVRVMKTRKHINHQQLVAEVLVQLKSFKPSIADIKKNIDNLIEKDYMERAEDTNSYNYIA